MGPLRAEISVNVLSEDSRGSVRRNLRLSLSISSPDSWSRALIHDLSETGLMIETAAPLAVGEIISFALPDGETAEARIVWKKGNRHGCEFLTPIPAGAVSIALLQATAESFDLVDPATIEELPVGANPSIDELAAWKAEFERTQGAKGKQLVGFRLASDGLLVALVTKSN